VTISAPALNQSAWEALLTRLGPDRDTAGAEYELLRRRLVRFFEWRGRTACEDHADVVLTRVARKIEAGETIQNIQSYALGVARFVLMELVAAPILVVVDGSTLTDHHVDAAGPDGEPNERTTCLERCLEQLPAHNRKTVLQYYEGEGGSKIANRQEMARQLAISDRALRLRVFRVRETLERCVHSCLGGLQRPSAKQR
jgi:DNA-directed RNA polymerase specialized sigma24 family protein